MRSTHTRAIAVVATLAAGALAAIALQPVNTPTTALAARQPVEVRTQVIRRTIHVIRHERTGHGPNPRGAVATGSPGHGSGGPVTAVRTSTSHHAVVAGTTVAASSAGAVVTRTSSHGTGSAGASPSASAGSSPAGGSHPVTTRTSKSSVSSSSGTSSGSKPVTTRSSSGGDGGGDKHDN